MTKLPARYQAFKKQHAKVWKAYDKLGATAGESGPLELKTRELIKLGMAAALRAESAVKSHTHRALEAGATSDEINHALILGVTTIGFPSMMTAWSWAQDAMEAVGKKD
ncbi:MAG: carboxymuconolactone decarboxylase family protein [Thermoflexales bacterium]